MKWRNWKVRFNWNCLVQFVMSLGLGNLNHRKWGKKLAQECFGSNFEAQWALSWILVSYCIWSYWNQQYYPLCCVPLCIKSGWCLQDPAHGIDLKESMWQRAKMLQYLHYICINSFYCLGPGWCWARVALGPYYSWEAHRCMYPDTGRGLAPTLQIEGVQGAGRLHLVLEVGWMKTRAKVARSWGVVCSPSLS